MSDDAIGKLQFSGKYVGRAREIEQIRSAYNSLGVRSAAVFVGGYAGIGKTRLVQHAV